MQNALFESISSTIKVFKTQKHRFVAIRTIRFRPQASVHKDADVAAERDAKALSAAVARKLLAVGESEVGYVPALLQEGRTLNTSRHVWLLTLLITELKKRKVRLRELVVAEVGAGPWE